MSRENVFTTLLARFKRVFYQDLYYLMHCPPATWKDFIVMATQRIDRIEVICKQSHPHK